MTNKIFKKIVVFIIKWQAKLVLIRYKPKVIAIIGSVGKTSTKDAIFTVLSKFKSVRKSEKSFNSEIGLPLTILGLPNGWSNFFIWLENIIRGFYLILVKQSYPKYLILEVGLGKPGDIIKNVVPWLKPDIVVVTSFPDKPVHIEFFESTKKIIEEKSALVYALKSKGLLVLNHDDEKVYSLHNKGNCKTISFGLNENSTYRATYPVYITKIYNGINAIGGINFKLEYGGNAFPVTLPNVVGLHYISTVLPALAIANEIGCDLLESIKAIGQYSTPPGRLSILSGIKNSMIIDDTYNSSPIAANAAVEVLREIEAKRKIIILGDMLELGKFTEEEHRFLGESIVSVADILITVGPRAKFINEGAEEKGFKKENIYYFSEVNQIGDFLKDFIENGDILLIKGSQGVRLEKAVEAIMKDKERKRELLCRQEKEWQNR